MSASSQKMSQFISQFTGRYPDSPELHGGIKLLNKCRFGSEYATQDTSKWCEVELVMAWHDSYLVQGTEVVAVRGKKEENKLKPCNRWAIL